VKVVEEVISITDGLGRLNPTLLQNVVASSLITSLILVFLNWLIVIPLNLV
jgi:hypothetical protein